MQHRFTLPAAVRTLFLTMSSTCVCFSATAIGADPPTGADAQQDRAQVVRAKEKATHDQIVADLTSGDDTRVKDALAKVRALTIRVWPRRDRQLQILLDANRPSDIEPIALDVLRSDPDSTNVGQVQKLRAQALVAQERWAEALSAARAYYDCSRLKDTPDAINLVTLCLVKARPEDARIANRFKRQQAAWATGLPPATQPAAAPGTVAADDLGTPVLLTIKVDGSPFADAITGLHPSDYKHFMYLGNLLLLSGRAKEAHNAFEQAQALVPDNRLPQAIEDVARAIRAENGCVGPANAYLTEAQK